MFFRPRSQSRNRNRPPPRCFNCNIIGHVASNCFTRTRGPPFRTSFPQRFTPNQPSKRNKTFQNQSRPPMVRFNERIQRIPPDYYDFSEDYPSAPQHIYNPQDRYPQNSTYQNRDDSYQYHQNSNYQNQQDSYQGPSQNAPQINYPNANGIQLTDTFDNLN